jgi:hypothetical protein
MYNYSKSSFEIQPLLDSACVADGPPEGGSVASEDPHVVTRGYLLQSSSLPHCDINPGVVLDWLRFTIPLSDLDKLPGVLHELRQTFGGADILLHGMSGYTRSIPILGGTGKIMWHPERVEMGVHVMLPAGALANIWADGLFENIPDFLSWVVEREGKFTRIDLAIDTDRVHMDTIEAACTDIVAGGQQTLVTRCQKVDLDKSLRGSKGKTVYVGSRNSDRFVRFYDKAVEQGLEDVVWTRCEIQHGGEHANVVAHSIIQGGIDPVELFNSVVDFRDPDSDPNPSRRSRCDWWEMWLGVCTSKVSFAIVQLDKAVKQVAEWVVTQVAPSLAMLAMADPENIKMWLSRIVEDGFGKLDVYRREKASRFRDLGYVLG